MATIAFADVRTAVLDTNILLLWLVAQTDPVIVEEFKRVRTFTADDCVLVARLLAPFAAILSTPHVLSETSNFVDQAPPKWRPRLIEAFRDFVLRTAEVYEPAVSLVDHQEFNSFGITDTALIKLSMNAVVITVDFPLSAKIDSMGGNTVNFNHYRSANLLKR